MLAFRARYRRRPGDIENLIKFSHRFRKTAKAQIGKRVLGEEGERSRRPLASSK
jgi:hypothetical protein